ncbi:FMN-binding negative transcriptional regulator [Rhodobacteraceae bacterium CCMM004]|nr:FMN-binding negative transcriptional regulator [Rhodobacteraceae bacterium CCMM004]
MHPNPAFRDTPEARSRALARARGFGVLAVNGGAAPLLAHVPFLLDDEGGTADLHLVRSNPIAAALRDGDLPAVIAVSGPDAYISPDWYGLQDQVPTWNYVAVHLRGTLSLLPQKAMRDMLDRQSAAFEAALAPKPPWMPAKMTPTVLERMMRSIVPCRLSGIALDATWKLGQNKPEAARLGAADGVAAAGRGTETDALAALMRDPS